MVMTTCESVACRCWFTVSMSGIFWNSSASEFVLVFPRPDAVIWKWKCPTVPSSVPSARVNRCSPFSEQRRRLQRLDGRRQRRQRFPRHSNVHVRSEVGHQIRTDVPVRAKRQQRKVCTLDGAECDNDLRIRARLGSCRAPSAPRRRGARPDPSHTLRRVTWQRGTTIRRLMTSSSPASLAGRLARCLDEQGNGAELVQREESGVLWTRLHRQRRFEFQLVAQLFLELLEGSRVSVGERIGQGDA